VGNLRLPDVHISGKGPSTSRKMGKPMASGITVILGQAQDIAWGVFTILGASSLKSWKE